MKIGFLGLGDMGLPMARRLAVISTIDSCRSVLPHIQLAGVPGRRWARPYLQDDAA